MTRYETSQHPDDGVWSYRLSDADGWSVWVDDFDTEHAARAHATKQISELDMPTGWLKISHHPLIGWAFHFEDPTGVLFAGVRWTRRGAIRAAKKQLQQIDR